MSRSVFLFMMTPEISWASLVCVCVCFPQNSSSQRLNSRREQKRNTHWYNGVKWWCWKCCPIHQLSNQSYSVTISMHYDDRRRLLLVLDLQEQTIYVPQSIQSVFPFAWSKWNNNNEFAKIQLDDIVNTVWRTILHNSKKLHFKIIFYLSALLIHFVLFLSFSW